MYALAARQRALGELHLHVLEHVVTLLHAPPAGRTGMIE